MPDNCTECSLTPDDTYADKLENRVLKGEGLIYYTKKIREEIAAATEGSSAGLDEKFEDLKGFIEEKVSAVEANADSRKNEIIENINNINEKLNTLDTLQSNLDAAVENLLSDSESKFNSLSEVVLESIANSQQAILEQLNYIKQEVLPYPFKLDCEESIISVEFEVPDDTSQDGGQA